jgi:diguanylate cyclase (GGDEF)-like protein
VSPLSSGYDKGMDEELRAKYLRHSPGSVSEGIEDVSATLALLAQGIEDDPGRTLELIGDLHACANYLDNMSATARILEDNAAFDPLTELPNKRHFREMLRADLSHAARQARHGVEQQLHVLFIDLDGFKSINDDPRLGHDAGDRYLQAVAAHMQGALHREYDVVARNGGDEFAALLLDCDDAAAHAIAERLRAAVHAGSSEAKAACASAIGASLSAGEANVSASIGLASFAGAGDTVDAILKRADQAMYAAKQSGKDRVVAYRDLSTYTVASVAAG